MWLQVCLYILLFSSFFCMLEYNIFITRALPSEFKYSKEKQAMSSEDIIFSFFFSFLIYRELLDDENFQESLTVIKNEPILYFNQFASQHQSTTKQVYETSIGSQRSIVDADHKRVRDTEQGPVDRSSALPESESQVLGEREPSTGCCLYRELQGHHY